MDKLPPDPFFSGTYKGVSGKIYSTSTVDSPGRLLRVKSFSRAECHDAIERDRRQPYLQKSVRKAIIAQLRRIERLEETR